MMSRRWRRRTIALMVSLFIINIPFCNYHSSFEHIWPAKVHSAAIPANEISLVQSIAPPLPLLSPLPASIIKPSEPQPTIHKTLKKISAKNRVSNNKICRNHKKKVNRPVRRSIVPRALEITPEEQPEIAPEIEEVALKMSKAEMDRINAKLQELNVTICKKLARKLAQSQRQYLKVIIVPTDDSSNLKIKSIVAVPADPVVPKI